MKKIFFLTLFAFSLAISTQAQVSRSEKSNQKVQSDEGRQMHKQQMKDLDLTKEQKAQMKEMRQNVKNQRDAIQNDGSLSADQKKAKMKEMHEDLKNKRDNIFTPDQKNKMKQMKKEKHNREKMNKKHHGKKHHDKKDHEKKHHEKD